jgi:hypothetical protein
LATPAKHENDWDLAKLFIFNAGSSYFRSTTVPSQSAVVVQFGFMTNHPGLRPPLLTEASEEGSRVLLKSVGEACGGSVQTEACGRSVRVRRAGEACGRAFAPRQRDPIYGSKRGRGTAANAPSAVRRPKRPRLAFQECPVHACTGVLHACNTPRQGVGSTPPIRVALKATQHGSNSHRHPSQRAGVASLNNTRLSRMFNSKACGRLGLKSGSLIFDGNF